MAWLGQVGHHEGDRGVFANNIHLAVELRLLGLKIGQRLGRLSVHALNPQHKSFLLLGVRPLVRRLATQTTPDGIRQILFAHVFRLRLPHGVRERGILRRIAGHFRTGLVPVRLAVKMSERPAIDFRPRFEADLCRVYFQSHPFPGFGQISQPVAACGLIFTPIYFVIAPIRAVFPRAVIELQHDLLGRIQCVEVNVRKQFHAFLNDQRRVGAANHKLLQPARFQHERLAAAEHRLGLTHSFPFLVALTGCFGGETVLNPNRLLRGRLWRHVEFGRVNICHLSRRLADAFFHRCNLLLQGHKFFLIARTWYAQDRWRVLLVTVHRRIGRAVKEGVHRVKLFRGKRIKFVIVAYRAARREAHPNLHRRRGAIDRVPVNPFLTDTTALAGAHVAAVEAGGDPLIHRRFWQQITGQLPAREFIELDVLIERPHHPIAVRPHGPLIIQVQPVRVCVAREVQPIARHVLAIRRSLHQAGDQTLQFLGRFIQQKAIHLGERRRQTCKIQIHAAHQRLRLGQRRGLQTFPSEASLQKCINRIRHLLGSLGHDRFLRRDERPMLLVLSPLLDPRLEDGLLLRAQGFLRVRRRH